MSPKISIITVVYNGHIELEKTLQALSTLKYDNKEIIIIDGGSCDGTLDVICKYSSYISYWVSEPDNGLYDAMNKGLSVASGEFVWFVNAGDTTFDDDTLEKVFIPSENYADIYYGEALIVDKQGVELGLRRKKVPKKLTKNSFVKGMVVCHQAFIVRKDIAPFYDLSIKLVADIDWAIKCIDKAKTIQNTHTIICKFEDGGISSSKRRESLVERWSVMKKRYGVTRTIIAHIGFIFDNIFFRGYRTL